MHKQLVRRFRQVYRSDIECAEAKSSRCFLTGRTTSLTSQGSRKKLCIDHCHKTLLLRGFVLGWMNRSMEFVEYQPQALKLSWKRGETNGKLGQAVRLFVQGMMTFSSLGVRVFRMYPFINMNLNLLHRKPFHTRICE